MLLDLNQGLKQQFQPMMYALWKLLTSNEVKWLESFEESEKKYQDYLTSQELDTLLGDLKSQPLTKREVRQIDVLDKEKLEFQASAELREEINKLWNEIHYHISTYMFKYKNNHLSQSELLSEIKSNKDLNEREHLWKSYMRMGQEIGPGLIKLVELRNKIAQQNGFNNFYELKLFAQETELVDLTTLCEEIRNGLASQYNKLKDELDDELCQNFNLKSENIMPWHYSHPTRLISNPEIHFDQQKYSDANFISNLINWFNKQGLDIEQIIERGDILNNNIKTKADFCLSLDRKDDIRISTHLTKNPESIFSLLHEIGHAVYEKNIDADLPFLLKQPANISLSEAIALLFEKLPLNLIDKSLPINTTSNSLKHRHLLFKTFSTLSIVEFERNLYKNPKQNLNNLWWDLIGDIQGINRPCEWDQPYWANISHFTTLPVYYHHYLFGEVLASQFEFNLNAEFKQWHSNEALQFLVSKICKPGMSSNWTNLLNGKFELSAKPFINQFK